MFQDLDNTLTAILSDAAMPTALADLLNADKVFSTPDKTFGAALPKPTVNLFLYEVNENRQLRENDPILEKVGNTFVQRPPPLRVDCCYLVTTWAVQQGAVNVAEEHSLLAQALLWLSQFREIPAGYLRGGMVNQVYPPQSWTAQIDTHKNTAEFWFALGIPPRPAFHLTVTVSLELPLQQSGALVTTLIAEHLQTGQVGPGETLVQIGGWVLAPPRNLVLASATATNTNATGTSVTVNNPAAFVAGDMVTQNGTSRATVSQIQGNTLVLDVPLAGLILNNPIRLADLVPGQQTFRLADVSGLQPGDVGFLRGEDATNPGKPISQQVTILKVDPMIGLVTLQTPDERAKTYSMNAAATIAPSFLPVLTGATVTLTGVSPNPISKLARQTTTDDAGRYIFDRLQPGQYQLQAVGAGFAPLPPSTTDVPSQSGVYDLQFT